MSAVAPRRAFLAGVEITNFVTDWGELDEIKSVLLGQDQLFTSQLKLKVANDTGIFSPGNPSSFLYGQQEYNQPVEVYFYNTQIFGGVLKASEVAYLEKTADLMIENQFSNLAIEICTASGSAWAGVNPALAILSLLQNAGLSAQVNRASFATAAGPALSAGAVVTLSYTASDQVYLLAAINDIANLASLTVYVQNSTIFCSVYQAYQGNGSNLRQTITAAYVRDWGTRVTAYNSFYNEVVVPYGASSQVQLDNVASQTATGTISTQSFSTNSGGTGSTGAIVVADSVSATFFAQQYLSRASVIRDTFSVKLGPEFANAVIGYRYPVTAALWGWQGKPFECIETKKTLLDKGIELTLASV